MPGPDLMTTAQIIFGLVVVLLIYIITLVVLNIDNVVESRSITVAPKEKTLIIDGYANSSYLAKRSYNTVNPFVEDFRKLGRSINTHGGAQFTYQFWIKMEDLTVSNYQNQVLILKGDNQKYKIGIYDNKHDPKKYTKVDEKGADYYIKSPLIKFGSSHKEIIVEFNTNRDINYRTRVSMKSDTEDPIGKRNVLSLLPLNWYLFTFVFEDNFSLVDTAENGIKFSFYINDFPYHVVNASSDPKLHNNFLRQNEGNLHILPDMAGINDFIKMGNLMYYNYALSQSEISGIYSKGQPKHSATFKEGKEPKPAYISAYNKMDIYNY